MTVASWIQRKPSGCLLRLSRPALRYVWYSAVCHPTLMDILQNSLTGAIFLSGISEGSSVVDPKNSQVIMVDIGGTTTDFAALAPSGFPRQSPATVKVGGVRTAFSLPELVSIGLGGGSLVVRR